MIKTIKVIDLFKEASEGNNITFRNGGTTYKDSLWTFINMYLDKRQSFDEIKELLNSEVIIEEQQEIDIQSIEEIKDIFIENSTCGEDVKYLAKKYNEILIAVKQLDKKIKEEE